MRYCTVCGFALDDDARFCPGCGTPASSERSVFSDPHEGGTGPSITAENLFNTTKQELSDMFSYSRLGKEFTGDLSIMRDRVRRTVNGTPTEALGSIASSNMADVRKRLSLIDDGVNDQNWGNIVDLMQNGIPAAIVSYFYDPALAYEVKNIMDRLKALSKKGWDKSSFLGKAAVPSAKFEDIYVLRYVTSNIKF